MDKILNFPLETAAVKLSSSPLSFKSRACVSHCDYNFQKALHVGMFVAVGVYFDLIVLYGLYRCLVY